MFNKNCLFKRQSKLKTLRFILKIIFKQKSICEFPIECKFINQANGINGLGFMNLFGAYLS